MNAAVPTSDALDALARRLVAAFERIGATRMAGVPLLNPRLAVEAVGFAPCDGAVIGVLITPWFMNLVRLGADDEVATPVGQKVSRTIGGTAFEFIGAHEAEVGAYEACSLFSPMFEFVDQAAARATAQSVLELLRAASPTAAEFGPFGLSASTSSGQAPSKPASLSATESKQPARRTFLFGRSTRSAP